MSKSRSARAAPGAGRISYRHAQALLEQSWSIPATGLPGFEAALLPAAETLTVAKLKHKARLLRERLHPESISARRTRSIDDRSSGTQPERDGMATLYLTTGAELVESIFARATGLATSLQGPGEPRTLTQLRTDVLSDLLVDGVTPTGVGNGVRASVHVTVPVMTLLGHSDRSARTAEIDHSHDWALLGETNHDNLAHLCKSNHALKTQTRWTVAQQPGGILTWTSPTGRDFVTEPATVLPTSSHSNAPPGSGATELPDDPPF